MESAEPYNYQSFPVGSDVEDFRRFPEIVTVGTHAPETTLTDLETGELISLRDVTRRGLTILEFGSLT